MCTGHRIDIHHHYFPASLEKASQNRSVGWRTPTENLPWTPELSLRAMEELGIDIAILSHPPISSGTVGPADRARARANNLFAAKVCEDHPGRFGFFATLPLLDDVEGALDEIAFALDGLRADGVSLASSYGVGADAKYVAHDTYDPIWAELDRRAAVVFLHGAQTPSSTPYPHDLLGIPITEVPNETFKAAAHLVTTGKRRTLCPRARIVLAHMGGATPLLAARVAVLSRHMGCALTPDEVLHDFKSFYFETALSGYETNLLALESFVGREGRCRVLFGTDFPAVSIDMADWYTHNVDKHYARDTGRLEDIMRRNALALFPRLRDVTTTKTT